MHRLASYQEQHNAIVKLNPNVDASRHRSNCISLGLRRVPGTNRTVSSRKTSKRRAFNPPIRFKVVTFVRGFNAMRPHYRTPRISFFTSMHFLLLPTSLAACRTYETVVYVKVMYVSNLINCRENILHLSKVIPVYFFFTEICYWEKNGISYRSDLFNNCLSRSMYSFITASLQ